MKRPVCDPIKGTYTIKNKEYKEIFGSREQVFNGTAYKTKAGLTKDDLIINNCVECDKYGTHVFFHRCFQSTHRVMECVECDGTPRRIHFTDQLLMLTKLLMKYQ